jgi:hypothetical protein
MWWWFNCDIQHDFGIYVMVGKWCPVAAFDHIGRFMWTLEAQEDSISNRGMVLTLNHVKF